MKALLGGVSKTYAGMPVRWGLQNHIPGECVLHTALLAIEFNKSHVSRLPQVSLYPELQHFHGTLASSSTDCRAGERLLLPASWVATGGREGCNFWKFVCLYKLPLLNLSSLWAYLSLEVVQTAALVLDVCDSTLCEQSRGGSDTLGPFVWWRCSAPNNAIWHHPSRQRI